MENDFAENGVQKVRRRNMRIIGPLMFAAFFAVEMRAQDTQAPKQDIQAKNAAPQPKAGMFSGVQPATTIVARLARMTPEERQRALANLPPAQRTRISNQLERFLALDRQEQARLRNQAMLLSRFPPARQQEIRQSLREFNQLDKDRKRVLAREMRALALLPALERRALMSSDAFINRFSVSERRVMADLAEIMPQGPPEPNEPAEF